MLYPDFEQYVAQNTLFAPHHRLLVAVSGGIDSMVLLHLAARFADTCAVAHCNFHLRADESDGDCALVQQTASAMNIACHVEHFDTAAYANKHGISIQMAARDLRYKWFEHLRLSEGFDYILIAHNANDVAETFHLNLTRTTGIKGLTGIAAKNGHIVRPLLFAPRHKVAAYATQHQVAFREDSSNSSVKYARNRIRHKVLPELATIAANYMPNLLKTIENLAETEQIFLQKINDEAQKCTTTRNGTTHINIAHLQTLRPLRTYLFEFLRTYNFNATIATQLADTFIKPDFEAGRMLYSNTHQLLIDRLTLQISPRTEGATELACFEVSEDTVAAGVLKLNDNEHLIFELIDANEVQFDRDHTVAIFDYQKLSFPLTVRHWQEGDKFSPFGMKGVKKVSDFFIDNKVSRTDKERIWLLCSGSNIAWVAPMRSDNRYRLQQDSHTALRVSYRKNI